jgi:hypothetical protein
MIGSSLISALCWLYLDPSPQSPDPSFNELRVADTAIDSL